MQVRFSSQSNRFFLGHFIEDAIIGQPFPRSNWPLHITIVPWFLCGCPDKLDVDLAKTLPALQKFNVKVGSETMFGSKKNIRVNTIETSSQLVNLHTILLNKVKKLGDLDSDKQFVDEGYRAHITHAKGRYIPQGNTVRISSIHLTELTDENHCTPLRHYEVGL